MTQDEWARTSIVVFDANGEAVESVDMPGGTLVAQLVAAETWLIERGLERHETGGDEARLRLFVSWAPPDERHSMTLPPSLIQALARSGGVFWMDVYPDD